MGSTTAKAVFCYDKGVADKEKSGTSALTKNGDHQFSQGEFNALVDLGYNAGPGALTADKSPSLMKVMSAGDYQGMSEQLRYTKNDRGETMQGLAVRSDERKEIFNGGDPK